MLIEIFIFLQFIAIGLFITSFFTKQEILWALTLLFTGVLMFTSFNIEYYVYEPNITTGMYTPVTINLSYPYLMGINLGFFVLAMVLGIFDIFDKYGTKMASRYDNNVEEKRQI